MSRRGSLRLTQIRGREIGLYVGSEHPAFIFPEVMAFWSVLGAPDFLVGWRR